MDGSGLQQIADPALAATLRAKVSCYHLPSPAALALALTKPAPSLTRTKPNPHQTSSAPSLQVNAFNVRTAAAVVSLATLLFVALPELL